MRESSNGAGSQQLSAARPRRRGSALLTCRKNTGGTARFFEWRGSQTIVRSPAEASRLGIAYVPEDRRRHGVILEMPVTANATLAVLDRISEHGWINFRRERALAGGYVKQLSIKTASLDTPVGDLSGGNQQKVSVARWLATEPELLILDEPQQGVDVGAKAEIHRLISELAGRGLAILMISSELPEILGMSD